MWKRIAGIGATAALALSMWGACRNEYVDLSLLAEQATLGTIGRAVRVEVDAPSAAQVRIVIHGGVFDHGELPDKTRLECFTLKRGELDTVIFVYPAESEATVTAEAVDDEANCARASTVGVESAVLLVTLGQGANDDGGGGGGGGANGGGGQSGGGGSAGGDEGGGGNRGTGGGGGSAGGPPNTGGGGAGGSQ